MTVLPIDQVRVVYHHIVTPLIIIAGFVLSTVFALRLLKFWWREKFSMLTTGMSLAPSNCLLSTTAVDPPGPKQKGRLRLVCRLSCKLLCLIVAECRL